MGIEVNGAKPTFGCYMTAPTPAQPPAGKPAEKEGVLTVVRGSADTGTSPREYAADSD